MAKKRTRTPAKFHKTPKTSTELFYGYLSDGLRWEIADRSAGDRWWRKEEAWLEKEAAAKDNEAHAAALKATREQIQQHKRAIVELSNQWRKWGN